MMEKMKIFFRKRFFGNKRSVQIAEEFLNLKVQSPFDKTQTIVMIDLLASTAITEKSILAVANSYGIGLPSQAVDVSGFHALEYLLYHGKKFHYTTYTDGGDRIVHGIERIGETEFLEGSLPLITGSHLDKVLDLFSLSNESFNSFYGQSVEFAVKYALLNRGYDVKMPIGRNVEGYDLAVEKRFFDHHDLPFVNHPDLNGYGLIQVKSTSNIIPTKDFSSNTEMHFSKYESIPVIASEKICEKINTDNSGEYIGKLVSFKDVGIEELNVENSIYEQYLSLKSLFNEDLIEKFGINTGLSSSHFQEILSNGRTYGIESISDIGLNHIPALGMFISGVVSTHKNYRLYKDGKIDTIRGLKNFTCDVTKTAIIGTSTIVTGTALTTAMGLSTQTSFNNSLESLSDGFDFGDLGDMAELALVIGIFVGIGQLARLAWKKICGDPWDSYKSLQEDKNRYSIEVLDCCNEIKELIRKKTLPDEYYKLFADMDKAISNLNKIEKSYKIYPLEYYVNRHKKNILNDIVYELEKGVRSIDNFLERANGLKNMLNEIDNKKLSVKYFKEKVLCLYGEADINELKIILEKLRNKKEFQYFLQGMIATEINRMLDFLSSVNNNDLSEKISLLDSCLQAIKVEELSLRTKGLLA
jgi:hypothetical protein